MGGEETGGLSVEILAEREAGSRYFTKVVSSVPLKLEGLP